MTESIEVFETKVSEAALALKAGLGDGWVETSSENIARICRNGLGGVKFFNYKNVFVCAFGDKDKCLSDMNLSAYEKAHGKEDGIVEAGR